MLSASFAAAVKAAAEATPMAVPLTLGRELLADGDALAYYCAGKDDTSPGQARTNLLMFLREAERASGSERVRVFVTGRGSDKGKRYAVAKVKPYQGNRSGGRRPKNWEFLREVLEGGVPGFPTEVTNNAEADDLFGRYSARLGAANVVILTQDKDMHMVPGWHMDWKTKELTFAPPGLWSLPYGDKVLGRKWFWLQMLMGDTADHIPGLPRYVKPNGKSVQCGEVTAYGILADVEKAAACAQVPENSIALNVVAGVYQDYYGDRWPLEFVEQAILLWMRNDEAGHVFNVFAPGNPLEHLTTNLPYTVNDAKRDIAERLVF